VNEDKAFPSGTGNGCLSPPYEHKLWIRWGQKEVDNESYYRYS